MVNMDVLSATTASRNSHPALAPNPRATAAPPEPPEPAPPELAATQETLPRIDITAADAPLLRSHHKEIWRYLRFLGCEDALADDLVQETFLAVLKKPPTSPDAAAVRAYLRTIARNQYLAHLRESNRQTKVDVAELEVEAAEEVWSAAHPRDGGEERLSALDDCLGQLEGRAKQAIDLTYRENHSRADIATKLDMSEDGIKSLLRRTRDALRQCVERKLAAGN
jgi:RNA polymerase sigma-70 factor, ECF subfamily